MATVTVVGKQAEWSLGDLRARLVPAFERAGVQKAIVFGSYARGTADAFSDLDMAVVLESSLPRFERPRLLDGVYRAVPVPIDLLVFRPEEFAAGTQSRMDVFDRIVSEGVVIYERASAAA